MHQTTPNAPPHKPPAFCFATDHFSEWQEFWAGGDMMPRGSFSLRIERTVGGRFHAGFALVAATPRMALSRLWSTPHKVTHAGTDAPQTHYYLSLPQTGRIICTYPGAKPQIWNRQWVSFGTPAVPYEQLIDTGGADGIAEVHLLQIARPLVDTLVRRMPPFNLLIPVSGPGALVAAYLRDMAPRMNEMDATANELFEQQLGALLALAIDIHPDAREIGRHAMRKAQLDRVLAYLDRRHTDPALTPEAVARTLGISVRYLHRLFEDHDGTFSHALLQRRLATAHRMLVAPDARHRTVLDVAFTAGFNSANAFYRAFRNAYGMTPTDARDVAARQ